MSRHNCWTCGNSYDGWERPYRSRNKLAEEQLRQARAEQRQAGRRHEEQTEAMQDLAAREAEQAARRDEASPERQTEAIQEASIARSRNGCS